MKRTTRTKNKILLIDITFIITSVSAFELIKSLRDKIVMLPLNYSMKNIHSLIRKPTNYYSKRHTSTEQGQAKISWSIDEKTVKEESKHDRSKPNKLDISQIPSLKDFLKQQSMVSPTTKNNDMEQVKQRQSKWLISFVYLAFL